LFQPRGKEERFRRQIPLDKPAWVRLLCEGRRHNEGIRPNGEQALQSFLEVFTPASRERGVEAAWEDVARRYGNSTG
jgi:hypothetical protein